MRRIFIFRRSNNNNNKQTAHITATQKQQQQHRRFILKKALIYTNVRDYSIGEVLQFFFRVFRVCCFFLAATRRIGVSSSSHVYFFLIGIWIWIWIATTFILYFFFFEFDGISSVMSVWQFTEIHHQKIKNLIWENALRLILIWCPFCCVILNEACISTLCV